MLWAHSFREIRVLYPYGMEVWQQAGMVTGAPAESSHLRPQTGSREHPGNGSWHLALKAYAHDRLPPEKLYLLPHRLSVRGKYSNM